MHRTLFSSLSFIILLVSSSLPATWSYGICIFMLRFRIIILYRFLSFLPVASFSSHWTPLHIISIFPSKWRLRFVECNIIFLYGCVRSFGCCFVPFLMKFASIWYLIIKFTSLRYHRNDDNSFIVCHGRTWIIGARFHWNFIYWFSELQFGINIEKTFYLIWNRLHAHCILWKIV